MFDFKELEAFVWVVRLGSFRKGATKLHLTQPSISDRITRLEDSVGESLLDRSARPVQPTFTHEHVLVPEAEAASNLARFISLQRCAKVSCEEIKRAA
ncbi:regulatory helix-turn-helix protein, lysR family [Chromohalobacter canadensis]|uniref:Regulatory helix-turn-helix protein, lysR family n=1 Tax=Chromohalobacter canadensis TaxID=141389 RepID=A0A285VMB8_9GAMM|nr:regulatory helix-turn-helix protein, lysR family [Chromohalobacter canadensis]